MSSILSVLTIIAFKRRTSRVSFAERDEHDARDQRALLADEGQPSVMDPESVPVQRSDTDAAQPHPAHLSG